ncbi:Endoglucanase 3 [Hordeum vulgare]|nr:Endoglucanase 3 [Hordeum vulgare]
MCVQAEQEPLYDYLMRWTELCNSYEGVHEVQDIQYFIEGCRDGTLLKHKIICSETANLAELMAKAEIYATDDSTMQIKVTATGKAATVGYAAAGCRQLGQQNNKLKSDQLDPEYTRKQVATMKEEKPAAEATSQRQRDDKGAWQPKLTFEEMLDAPCKMHTGAKPATHMLRQCSFS